MSPTNKFNTDPFPSQNAKSADLLEEIPVSDEPELDIITKIEIQTGQRYESNDGQNDTMATLIGMMARELNNKSRLRPEDDLAIGLLIRHQMSPQGRAEEEANRALAHMFTSGISPDDVLTLKKALS